MKTTYFFFALLVFITISIYSQVPTDAGIPDANHVLVVWNGNATIYDSVMQYYVDARNIPSSNIVRLDLPDSIEINIEGDTHWVGIRQETDIIRDLYQHYNNATTPTFHAWRYYLDYVATPIKSWISSHNLESTLRYILLVKGIPFKIQAQGDWAGAPGNIVFDGLLSVLNTDGYESFIENLYIINGSISNPYYNPDPNLTMEHRFLPDHYNGAGYTLSYLVSHLDGISFDEVKSIINKSIDPDMSGTAAWILDDDPAHDFGNHYTLLATKDKLEELDFTVVYNNDNTWITSYIGNVMGYTSLGTHAEDKNCEWEDSAWVKDSLHFDLANGSVFNTYESFNGNSMTTLKWRYVPRIPPDCHHTQGLATQFTQIGGTGTMGHGWEPGGISVDDLIFFPAYAIGYNLIDAIYQGMNSLTQQSVVVGDPLTRIRDCENTVILEDTRIGSGDYECNVIVPLNVTLTIESGSTINFKQNASLKVYGTVETENNVVLNFDGYSKFLVDSSGNLSIGSETQLIFSDHAKFIIDHVFDFNYGNNYVFDDESEFRVRGLNMNLYWFSGKWNFRLNK